MSVLQRDTNNPDEFEIAAIFKQHRPIATFKGLKSPINEVFIWVNRLAE
jgi:hypothetical protein